MQLLYSSFAISCLVLAASVFLPSGKPIPLPLLQGL